MGWGINKIYNSTYNIALGVMDEVYGIWNASIIHRSGLVGCCCQKTENKKNHFSEEWCL